MGLVHVALRTWHTSRLKFGKGKVLSLRTVTPTQTSRSCDPYSVKYSQLGTRARFLLCAHWLSLSHTSYCCNPYSVKYLQLGTRARSMLWAQFILGQVLTIGRAGSCLCASIQVAIVIHTRSTVGTGKVFDFVKSVFMNLHIMQLCVLKFMVCTWPRLKCADKLVTRVISHVHHGPNSITPRKCIVYKKIGSNLASALHPKGTLS